MTTGTAQKTHKTKRKIKIRLDQFAECAAVYGWTTNAAAAEALGVSESQVSRVLSGKAYPNDEFVAALLDVAKITGFRRMFEIVHIDLATKKEVTNA